MMPKKTRLERRKRRKVLNQVKRHLRVWDDLEADLAALVAMGYLIEVEQGVYVPLPDLDDNAAWSQQ